MFNKQNKREYTPDGEFDQLQDDEFRLAERKVDRYSGKKDSSYDDDFSVKNPSYKKDRKRINKDLKRISKGLIDPEDYEDIYED